MNMDEKRIKSYKYIIKLIFQALILMKAYKIKSRGLQKVNKNVDFMLKVWIALVYIKAKADKYLPVGSCKKTVCNLNHYIKFPHTYTFWRTRHIISYVLKKVWTQFCWSWKKAWQLRANLVFKNKLLYLASLLMLVLFIKYNIRWFQWSKNKSSRVLNYTFSAGSTKVRL